METLYTVREVANMLKINKLTVYHWINEGKIKVVRVSDRVIRIEESELKRLLSKDIGGFVDKKEGVK